jgi:hypothetical protein
MIHCPHCLKPIRSLGGLCGARSRSGFYTCTKAAEHVATPDTASHATRETVCGLLIEWPDNPQPLKEKR